MDGSQRQFEHVVELRTLGATEVRVVAGDGNPRSLSLQPKRLALFSYLVLARPRSLQRRDSVLVVFWPEESEHRARSALNQTQGGERLAACGYATSPRPSKPA